MTVQLWTHLSCNDRPAGVSDGVGGWSLSGVDAGEYSRLLMIMAKLFSESARTPPTPSQIMHSAYNQTQV